MMSPCDVKFSSNRQKLRILSDKFEGALCKGLAIAGLMLYLTYIFLSNHPYGQSLNLVSSLIFKKHVTNSCTTTNITHIVFGMVGSVNTWRNKRVYIDEWWRPNITRGFVWLDRAPTEYLPWPSQSPPFRVSEDTGRFNDYNRHAMPHAIRMVRVILETFREVNKNVRWYVMADDDTILLVDNLVEVLALHDHNKYIYVGENSESVASNYENSFEMAFGGAGYALSFPLAKALARNLDQCIKRYPSLYGSDHILQSCVSDLGVSLTHNRGFHQIDLHGDISGILSAHPPVPLLSIHHLDQVDPIFPSMNRYESVKHLMEASKADSSRLLQQIICYQKQTNWSFSISWGYSAQIYEKLHPPSYLERPLQTFIPWKNTARPQFMFNTRPISNDPCEVPHFFFFDSIEQAEGIQIVTTYVRESSRKLEANLSSGNHSAELITMIRVFSPAKRLNWVGRRECCDIVGMSGIDVIEARIRGCMKEEIVG